MVRAPLHSRCRFLLVISVDAMPVQGLSRRAAWAEGQPISDLMATALANPQLISLAAGFVDQQTLPVGPTHAAIEALVATPERARRALQYGITPGYAPLRERLIEQLELPPGLPAPSVEQVVITAGSNQLLHLVCESLLDPGDIVLCAAPTYLVFLGTLGNLGCRSYGVATDRQGMIPEALVEALERLEHDGELSRVKAIYLVPYFDNPQGVSMPQHRREAVVEIAKRWSRRNHHLHVIEDAAYRLLRYEGDDIPSMWTVDEEHDTVVVAGTFSKTFSPGLRVGWGILPEHLVRPVCNQKGNIDFGSPNFNQFIMAEVLDQGLFMPHVEYLRKAYSRKLECMLAAAEREFAPLPGVEWVRPQGGLYVWVTLPEEIETGPSGTLQDVAMEEGVLYVPGQYCFPLEGEPAHANTMRLSFGVPTCENIEKGMAALARAIRRVMDGGA